MEIFKTRTFKWWEMVLIKICLISLGILLALYFYDYLVSFRWFWWALFVATGAYFIARCFHGE